MRPALRQTRRLLNDQHALHPSIPTFLCPALLRAPIAHANQRAQNVRPAKMFSTFRATSQETTVTVLSESAPPTAPSEKSLPATRIRRPLPRACPGCGAPTQIYDKKEAGFYSLNRNAVAKYLEFDPEAKESEGKKEDVYTKALKQMDPTVLEEIGLERDVLEEKNEIDASPPETPVCDRCHNLVHHRVGTPIYHPSVEAIQQTIAESPHRRNHIYHVVDAADFPLSLIPTLQSTLRIPKLRTKNRRAKHKGWVANDRIAEVSFIITRSDLLARKKEDVDALMPYVQNVLRDALGRTNKDARLGNVRLVSAKRGWWTKQVKEEIWERGGAGWMVGKVNVGKSNLFEAVFPKGRGADYQDVRRIRSAAEREAMLQAAQSLDELIAVQKQLADEDAQIERQEQNPNSKEHQHQSADTAEEKQIDENDEDLDPDALLPPAQPYTLYPVLPIVSSLPGTTASPIRIPFGRNKGELVDMPGLARSSQGLETFVQPKAQDDLIMKSRITAQRFILKPGQSLLLGGGLIRITPVTQDMIFLIHPFVPIEPHVTRTDKAAALQAQVSDRHVESILAEDVGSKMHSAGRFKLKWDVTKKLAGPLTSSVAAKMRPENLPFRIFSTDILVEGVGWLEISAQVRRAQGWKPVGMVKKDPNAARNAKIAVQKKMAEELRLKREAKMRGEQYVKTRDEEEDVQDVSEFPEVEVFSPLGKFVGARMPMCASIVSGPKQISSRERTTRPRRSMKSVKAQRKPMEK
ncbi:Mitochondrial ribosome small subunit biogenesis protein [Didymosphaeria variabile]|uniref:Mitochondrial ribosome small subunit biogenesis protein n=1 Tax=Didymosphaeria variabile TaxID=1932322 RepID=A0A9W8XPN3_9PLEO|nr:Mitochondrial ribosome small subunit biogenesis protein [Didymosphaeria variabile]KAJ4356269.1 Mitochondrial ribosome small subunit biogenesis protein [Didymosphaeria variabile]